MDEHRSRSWVYGAETFLHSPAHGHPPALGTTRGAGLTVEVLPDLSHELPLDDLHSHSLPRWLRGFIGCKHIVIRNGSLILITVHFVLHELLGHLYGLVILPAVVGKRKERYSLVNVPSL